MFGDKIIDKRDTMFLGKLYQVIEYENSIKWKLNGVVHREGDKPAVIYKNGTKEWRLFGKLHREGDKPAILRNNGNEEYYINGVRHRNFGRPAIKNLHSQDYFEFGKKLTKEQVKMKYNIGNF